MDDFSLRAFASEWRQVELTQQGWRAQVQAEPLDLLVVESAWNANHGSWQYALTGSKAPVPELRALVDWCTGQGIPTVFWNKEDPVHFDDFIDTARLFDVVLTTDGDMVPTYRDMLGHDRVHSMPFAAASWIQNPVRRQGRPVRDIAFAGMYFTHKYPERRAQMDLLLGAACSVSPRLETGLDIFSRFHGGDARYQFPAPFDEYVVGSLRYDQMLSAYRDYKVFLNVSSVPDSSTMCPRRVFEISACATPVVSTPTPAIDNVFAPDEMVTVSEPEQARWTLRALVGNDEWRERLAHRAARRVLSEHTYRHRVDDLLGHVDLTAHRVIDPSVSVVTATNRPHQVEHILRSVAAQREVRAQLVLVTHGFDAPPWLQDKADELGLASVEVRQAEPSLSLGACLNHGIQAADGDVVAKMDDDDLYGPHYLADHLRALDYSGAEVVGKRAHHMLISDTGALVVRFPYYERMLTDLVMGPTLMLHRDLATRLPFADLTRGEDTDFLRRVLLEGGRIYASDRYNFVQVRRDTGHTWQVSTAELLANARVVAFGAGTEHVFV